MRLNVTAFIKSHLTGIAVGVLTIFSQRYMGHFAILLMIVLFLYSIGKIAAASKGRPEEFYLKFSSLAIGVPVGLFTGFFLWRKSAYQDHSFFMIGCAMILYLGLFASNSNAQKRLQ